MGEPAWQLLGREVAHAIRLMKLTADGKTLLIALKDQSMMILWRGAPTVEPAPAEIDPVTMMAYNAMMLEPDFAYDPLAGVLPCESAFKPGTGSPWNHRAEILTPTELQHLPVVSAAIVQSVETNHVLAILVLEGAGVVSIFGLNAGCSGGLVSVFRTEIDQEYGSEVSLGMLGSADMGMIPLIFLALFICAGSLALAAPHPLDDIGG